MLSGQLYRAALYWLLWEQLISDTLQRVMSVDILLVECL